MTVAGLEEMGCTAARRLTAHSGIRRIGDAALKCADGGFAYATPRVRTDLIDEAACIQ